ncbi:MAG: hypothetical protein K8T90_07180 [Planctomycetes bacterium]|nr:hypothetical protein [Planctomycetota bacterium]
MTPPSDPTADLESLRRMTSDVAAWLDRAAADAQAGGLDRLARVNPGVSQWSPRQQIDHAALATLSICRAVDAILTRAPGCVGPGAQQPNLQMILATGFIPRGRADAPEKMKPPPDVTHAATRAHLDALAEALGALSPRLVGARIGSGDGGGAARFPHFALGPMSTAEWLRFACIHFDHHVALAHDAADA